MSWYHLRDEIFEFASGYVIRHDPNADTRAADVGVFGDDGAVEIGGRRYLNVVVGGDYPARDFLPTVDWVGISVNDETNGGDVWPVDVTAYPVQHTVDALGVIK